MNGPLGRGASADVTPACSSVAAYREALDVLQGQRGLPAAVVEPLRELIALLEITTALASASAGEPMPEPALRLVMRQLGADSACLLVQDDDGRFRLHSSLVVAPPSLDPSARLAGDGPEAFEDVIERGSGRQRDLLDRTGVEVLCPVVRAGRTIALLGLGPRTDGQPYDPRQIEFVRAVASCAAAPIENGLMYAEVERLNQRLSVKVFQLQNLFEVSRVLAASLDGEVVKDLFTAQVMGHLLISRCALYLAAPGQGLVLARARGLHLDSLPRELALADTEKALGGLEQPVPIESLAPGELRDALRRQGLKLAVPVPPGVGSASVGLVALGERASGTPFTDEDLDFVQTLAGQAQAALESTRLHRVEVEKQRQDRDIQIARQIQQSLLPQECPVVPGFQVAARGYPSRQVGGDHYDFIPLEDGRLALVIADVAGKGTPASILMASVHASVRALAGTADPARLVARLNRFLHASTEAHRYVTLFYAELLPASGRLVYVNAGHVPPYLLRAGGGCTERLVAGGRALGLFAEADYEEAEVDLGCGDLLAMVTDGVTEAAPEDGHEFGDEGVWATLLRGRELDAETALFALVESARTWAGAAGCADDLTAMVLKALPA